MLIQALGAAVNVPQWFVWRLQWSPEKRKYIKQPCPPDGSIYFVDAAQPKNWHTFTDALANVQRLDADALAYDPSGVLRYALGFHLGDGSCGYWFADFDRLDYLEHFRSRFPGAFFEMSCSGTGFHLLGRGIVPKHGCRNKSMGMELYTADRGVCFGLTGVAEGMIDLDHTGAIGGFAAEFFPPRGSDDYVPGEFDNGPRPDWDGYTDDDELIGKAIRSRSPKGAFSGKASFADLWNANIVTLANTYPPDSDNDREAGYGQSEADMALASHLAWWTGCDAERMVRLMWRSKLARDKWTTHATYLRELTIYAACASFGGREVYTKRTTLVERPPENQVTPTVHPIAAAPTVTVQIQADNNAGPVVLGHEPTTEAGPAANIPAENAIIDRSPDEYIRRIANASRETLTNVIVPSIAADLTLSAFAREELVEVVVKRLLDFGLKMTVSSIRGMLKPLGDTDDDSSNGDFGPPPDWLENWIYLNGVDRMFNIMTGERLTKSAFSDTYSRFMPLRSNGQREDPTDWALNNWQVTIASDIMYLPFESKTVFMRQGRWYANSYVAMSVPSVSNSISDETADCIRLFYRHLENLCGNRRYVVDALFGFIVHNVRYPGVKIRWAPLIKGIQGDGKSIIGRLLSNVMGVTNASPLSPAAVRSEYNDWAGDCALRIVEELKMGGKRRAEAANDLKPLITEDTVGLNRKGQTAITVPNVTNYLALTNYANAIPIEKTDRRWFIIFTQWATLEEMAAICGYATVMDLHAAFERIQQSISACPGEWRQWLMSCEVPVDFKRNGHAPLTDEKAVMRECGRDEYTQIALSILEEPSCGIAGDVVSSSHLSKMMATVCARSNIELPKGPAMSLMMEDLGYQRGPRMSWNGDACRFWVKRPMSPDEVRRHVDPTVGLSPAAVAFAK